MGRINFIYKKVGVFQTTSFTNTKKEVHFLGKARVGRPLKIYHFLNAAAVYGWSVLACLAPNVYPGRGTFYI